ncbi:hypothetical protein SERLA73DRAFT_27470, partial [Serpula lacrymans var. lacrymans S7.3]
NKVFTPHLFVLTATADGPGIVYLSSLVGYHRHYGCHIDCGFVGQCKPNILHYYPALLKPIDYNVQGCNHEDVDVHQLTK